ncbi:alpha/beta fold hydrolase [Iodobacter sp. HSC-16F04]|uniref:Alpha/beta fold hydrolase n=1 Tax=Iodobacter violaceini TaxID=3044271 RepID=A0ABX0KTH3_9NEIS|nr:alpha/beta fold hydrolase [Iodobacter violacea]NHQ87970.1 alpha/beta fold hydrolase [Iodobacter violacea]
MVKYLMLFVFLSANALAANVGIQEKNLEDSERSLLLRLWYPTDSLAQMEPLLKTDTVFKSPNAVPDAPYGLATRPLILLSHGLNGSWVNLAWLAENLAGKGALVLTLDHPGTSFKSRNNVETPRLWERPKDISRAISLLLDDPIWKTRIDQHKITVIGHSMGGYTALALAGARFNTEQFLQSCQQYPLFADCRWYMAQHASGSQQDMESDLHDARISAVVSLDLGFVGGMDRSSLKKIKIPILVLAAGDQEPSLPSQYQSRLLVKSLRKVEYFEYSDASHFSFIAECKKGALDLLREEGPGEEVICLDYQGRSRSELHEEVAGAISTFLNKQALLPAQN